METPAPVSDLDTEKKRGSVGSVIAILIIVLLLVVGAFYVWGQRIAEKRAQEALPSADPASL